MTKKKRKVGRPRKKKTIKPLPKMTPKRRKKIADDYYRYNRKYFPSSTPKRKKKKKR